MTRTPGQAGPGDGGGGRTGHLDELVGRARAYRAEFGTCLANHLPMALVALDRLGATERRLEAFFDGYVRANGLEPARPDGGRVGIANWRDGLGRRELEGDHRAFFAGEVARLGPDRALRLYLPTLVPGIAASALHALMRLAYARLRGDAAEVAAALGYWAATYLPLGGSRGGGWRGAGGVAPTTDDPAALLAPLREVGALHGLRPPSDLLWHWMREAAAQPGFPPVVDMLAPSPDLLARVAGTGLALMAGTMSFEALHAVTAAHWLRMVGDAWPDPGLATRHVWQAVAAVVPKMGFPELPPEAALAALRHAPAPPWPAILERAVLSDDEHDVSFTFSALEEERAYGDPLYRALAARRLGLAG